MNNYKEKTEWLRTLKKLYKSGENTNKIRLEIIKLDSELKDIDKTMRIYADGDGNYKKQVNQGKNLTLWQKIISIV